MITCTKDLDGNLHFSDDRALLPSRAILDSLMHFQLWIQRTFLHARRDFVMRRQWWQLRLRRDEPLPLPPYRVSSPPVTRVSDNPFEPAESALQRNLRIARHIRENVEDRMKADFALQAIKNNTGFGV